MFPAFFLNKPEYYLFYGVFYIIPSIIEESRNNLLRRVFMQKIMDAVECVLEFLRKLHLSQGTIDRYKQDFRNSIIPYCEINGIISFTDEDMQSYAKVQMSKAKNGELRMDYAQRLRRPATLLADCMHGRELVWGQKFYKYSNLSELFEKTLADFKTQISLSFSPNSVKKYTCTIRQFLAFLEHIGIDDLNKLTSEKVKDFIASAAPNHKSSMPALTGTMRKFLSFLNDAGITVINAERYLANPASRHRKLLPCFTDDEADAILGIVDRNTPLGKRDYAIMKIALWTGLRGTDIIGLKRSDIDWEHKVINVVQDKTGVYLQTELSPGLGNTIADYIMNGRPETDSPFIFVRHDKPYGMLGSSAGAMIIERYREKAGVSHEAWDGKTFHAFRRTLGTRLVRAKVPIRSVAEMLGQLVENSAKRYVALDNDNLRVCCLDIFEHMSRKDGLI